MRSPWLRVLSFVCIAWCVGCGARTGLRQPDARRADVVDDLRDADTPDLFDATDVFDAPDVFDATDAPDIVDAPDVRDVFDAADVCVAVRDGCEPTERCGNGLDDNCDGRVDESCTCTPGAVQPCFAGPPGRRNIGACRDGVQRCVGMGTVGAWGACEGGISPGPEVCNAVDDTCTGCLRETMCPILCPSPGDPRVPDGQPFAPYALRGALFFPGAAQRWRWSVRGGPCDTLVTRPSFALTGEGTRDAVFTPTLSGDYTVTLTVVTMEGTTLTCTFVVHIAGPGLRIELCWDRSETVDVDLYVRGPRGWGAPWWPSVGSILPNLDTCSWANCEAPIRGELQDGGGPVPRLDWGYARSALSACVNGPHGDVWRSLGFCANPRLDIDNNLEKTRGTPENINIDAPRDGETFRVMAHNFTGTDTHPVVNIYCAGRRYATYGATPDLVTGFAATGGHGRGAVWRAVDVTTRVSASGAVTCEVRPIHPPGRTSGYDVTIDNHHF